MPKNHIPITVIVPTFRQRKYVRAAIEGLYAQTYPIDELIVSDDASDDGTWEEITAAIADCQARPHQVRRCVVRRNEGNLGIARHFQVLAQASSNDLIVCNAGDDISEPDRIRCIAEDYERAGAPRHYLAHTAVMTLGEAEPKLMHPPVIAQAMSLEQMATASALHIGGTQAYSRALFDDYGPIAPDTYEDLVLGFRAAMSGSYRYIDQPLLRYRLGGTSAPERAQQWPRARWLAHLRTLYLQRLTDASHAGRTDLAKLIARMYLELGPSPEGGIPQAIYAQLATTLNQAQAAVPRHTATDASLRVGVRIRSDGASDTALQATQASLAAQTRPADQVLVATQPWPAPDLPPDPHAWTLLLCAGDTLEPHALAALERAVLDHPSPATPCLVYSDHDERLPEGGLRHPVFKPGPLPDYMLSLPYMGRALMVRNDWAHRWLDRDAPGEELVAAYRLMLEAMGGGSQQIVHLPAPLLHLSPGPAAMLADTSGLWQALANELTRHLAQSEPGSAVLEGPAPGTFHVVPPLPRTPKVSIVIPTRDQLPLLGRCIESVLGKTDYPDFELIVVDNDSQTVEAREFLAGLAGMGNERVRVLAMPGPFNFSKMNNAAVAQARGEFVLLLNNDTAVLQGDWLSHLMRQALRPGVGIVGARLLFPDGRVQHAGVVMGLRGPADHPALGLAAQEPGYMFRAQLTQNFSAVTAACLLVSKSLYESVGGLDEETFGVSYNDVDFCLRVGQRGLRIVWTPLATLLHEGSASQRAAVENATFAQKRIRFTREQAAMYERWPAVIASDPAYNPNLSLVERGYEIEINPLLCHDPAAGAPGHKVIAFPGDSHGCGHYRILQPMRAMLDQGLCRGGPSSELFGPNLALRSGADVLVLQRPVNDEALGVLESLRPLRGIRKVYEIDDDLARIPASSVHATGVPADIRERMVRGIGLCDRLIVSTEPLARALAGTHEDIRVIPNRLPPQWWGASPPARACQPGVRPRVAWAGGAGHQGDLMMIAEVIRELSGRVDWIFFGMCPDALKPYVAETHAPVPTPDYPARLMALAAGWDLAIAPLEANPFNECKSNLRLLEYGWCGLPVVCSDVLPYQTDLPAIRVPNRTADWQRTILALLAEPETLETAGRRLQEKVAQDWTLRDAHLKAWCDAWTGA